MVTSTAIVRGEVLEVSDASSLTSTDRIATSSTARHAAPVTIPGRGDVAFTVPDPAAVVPRLTTRDPELTRELDALGVDEILDYLVELGERLRDNPYLEEAAEHSAGLADVPPQLVRSNHRLLPEHFTRPALEEVVDAVGRDVLDGWPERRTVDGRIGAVHAFGVRAVHVIAGNSPLIAAMTLVRTAITRGEAIVKTPSNDPLTMPALARTMIDVAPGHPLTRAVSTAYWPGGSEEIERLLYHPGAVDKIVAWGGMNSVRHVVRYLTPGLELVTFDPKNSATILGPEAFAPGAVDDVAARLALDVGAFNQTGCVNARVVYAACGTDEAGIARAEDLARRVHAAMAQLPPEVSTPSLGPEMRARLRALRASGFHTVVGCDGSGSVGVGRNDIHSDRGALGDHGAVIVSRLDEPVDFADALCGRVANIVPVDSVGDALRFLDASTQTVGVWPGSLRRELRTVLGRHGVQRSVELGAAVSVHPALPQDGFEPVRRMVRWVTDEHLPDGVDPLDLVYPPHRERVTTGPVVTQGVTT